MKWRSFDCRVTFKDEKAACDATLQAYKGETPDDLDGRHHGLDHKGTCVEFSTHDIMVMAEGSAAWNEVTLRATFDPATMFEMAGSDLLQEVELGYRIHEQEAGQSLDRYYYPLLRVPIFYVGPGLAAAGVATRAFLGKEVDRMPDVTGRYWYVYGGMQVPLLNASIPKRTLVDNGVATLVPSDSISGSVHVVLTIEDFETYGFTAVPFVIPLFKTIGEIAGVGALMVWVTFRFQKTNVLGQLQERGSTRLVTFTESELDTDRDYDQVAGHSDLEVESDNLIARGAQE